MTGFQAFLKALWGGGWVSALSSVVTILVTYGAFNGAQASSVNHLAATIASALAAIVAVVHNFQATKAVQAASQRSVGK